MIWLKGKKQFWKRTFMNNCKYCYHKVLWFTNQYYDQMTPSYFSSLIGIVCANLEVDAKDSQLFWSNWKVGALTHTVTKWANTIEGRRSQVPKPNYSLWLKISKTISGRYLEQHFWHLKILEHNVIFLQSCNKKHLSVKQEQSRYFPTSW